MKTNQILTRKMGDFEVLQRTSDGMFNATTLLNQWNASNKQKKEVKKFFENENTKEFISALISEENLHGQNSAYVKSKASRGSNAGTWMHPILFVKFAMWINPRFEVKVIRFVYDQLIKYRNEAGDAYKEMTSAVSKLVSRDFVSFAIKDIARSLNYVVYNEHTPGIRNTHADERRLKELFELERDVAKLIHFGFIKNFEELKIHLRKRWSEKWQPKCLMT
jgi:KilA-N domain.